jgi:predicted transcriptional regulator
MKVAEIMTQCVRHCRMTDSLEHVAKLMWDHDVGALPVLDGRGDTVAMITDRDVCMAAYTQGKPLHEIRVSTAASHGIHFVRPDDSLEAAQALMKMHRVRRVPVLDAGGNLVGVIAVTDVIRRARSSREAGDPLDLDQVVRTLGEVLRPHDPRLHPDEVGGAESPAATAHRRDA